MELTKMTDDELAYYQESLILDEDSEKRKKYHDIINNISNNTNSIMSLVNNINMFITENTFDEKFNNELCKLIRLYEKGYSYSRTLPVEFGCRYEREEYYKNSTPANINLSIDDGILHIIMPSLLPKRNIGSSDLNTLRHSYYSVFYEFFKNGKYKVYEDKVIIVFTHHYDEHTPMRDNDNTETKVIVDLISSFTLIDDSPNWCDIYIRSVRDTLTFSEVRVVPQSQFSFT